MPCSDVTPAACISPTMGATSVALAMARALRASRPTVRAVAVRLPDLPIPLVGLLIAATSPDRTPIADDASTSLGRCLLHCGVNPASSVLFPSKVQPFGGWRASMITPGKRTVSAQLLDAVASSLRTLLVRQPGRLSVLRAQNHLCLVLGPSARRNPFF